MTAKEYLQQARQMNVRIEALRERRRRYEVLATQCTTHYRYSAGGSRHGTTRQVSSVEEYGCRMADLAREIERRIDDLARLSWEIGETIDAVPDQRYRDLLTYRYLNGWSWERIAQVMMYSVDRIWHLHREALNAVKVPGAA